MKVLCVAEKPSISKSITQILSGGRFSTVSLVLMSYYMKKLMHLSEKQSE